MDCVPAAHITFACELEGPHLLNLMIRLFVVLFSAALVAAGTDTLPPKFELACSRYYRAIEGDEAAYRSALTLSLAMQCERSGTPFGDAYDGSLQSVEASHTWALGNTRSLQQ